MPVQHAHPSQTSSAGVAMTPRCEGDEGLDRGCFRTFVRCTAHFAVECAGASVPAFSCRRCAVDPAAQVLRSQDPLPALCALWLRRRQTGPQTHALLRSARRRTAQHAWAFLRGGSVGQSVGKRFFCVTCAAARTQGAPSRLFCAIRNALARRPQPVHRSRPRRWLTLLAARRERARPWTLRLAASVSDCLELWTDVRRQRHGRVCALCLHPETSARCRCPGTAGSRARGPAQQIRLDGSTEHTLVDLRTTSCSAWRALGFPAWFQACCAVGFRSWGCCACLVGPVAPGASFPFWTCSLFAAMSCRATFEPVSVSALLGLSLRDLLACRVG